MRALGPPPISFEGRWYDSAELSAMAAGWLDFLHDRTRPPVGLAALVLANHPDAVALFFALSTLPIPLVVLAPEPRTWRTSPPLPAGLPLFLPPAQRHLAAAAEAIGARPEAMPPPRPGPAIEEGVLRGPGLVAFTSGSTGLPKPVYIATQSLLAQTAAVIDAYRLTAGCGIVGSLPLASHYGLGHALFLPTVLASPLGLVERFDHRSVLDLFASERYSYWAATPLMADLLGRAPVPLPRPTSPPICHVSAGRLSPVAFRAYRERFGVSLRPSYGRTENGFITVDTAPPAAVRVDAAGQPAPGIQIRIGEDPREPAPPGAMGRVWFTSPWYMEGYGFPPRLEPRDGRDGWWPTEDVGMLDRTGYLILAGRVDECFKTPSGHLVNPAQIARALTSHPQVQDAVVVPVPASAGPVIGALVAGGLAVDQETLRRHAAQALPPWLQPHVLLVIDELPRLPGGKVDRQATIVRLGDALGRQGRAGGAEDSGRPLTPPTAPETGAGLP